MTVLATQYKSVQQLHSVLGDVIDKPMSMAEPVIKAKLTADIAKVCDAFRCQLDLGTHRNVLQVRYQYLPHCACMICPVHMHSACVFVYCMHCHVTLCCLTSVGPGRGNCFTSITFNS